MKKTLVLLYNTSCIYEIVILNYFLRFTGKVAKKMDLFENEADLQETIAFWRDYQRMQ